MGIKRGLKKLTPKELSLLNVVINGKMVRSFYSDNGEVIPSRSPTYKQMKSFATKHKIIYALDGTLIKRMPFGGRDIYLFRERHGISNKMIDAISEESMMLNDSIKKRVFERDGKICAVCGSSKKLCVDHIFPVSRGGFTEIENLQVLCEKCNLQKSNMTMEEFNKWRENNGKTYKARS